MTSMFELEVEVELGQLQPGRPLRMHLKLNGTPVVIEGSVGRLLKDHKGKIVGVETRTYGTGGPARIALFPQSTLVKVDEPRISSLDHLLKARTPVVGVPTRFRD